MIKKLFAILMVMLLITGLRLDKACTDIPGAKTHKIEYLPNYPGSPELRRPDSTTNILRTPFSKVEYLISQAAGIGYGRPGTEEFLNADIIVKLKDDGNIYGFSLTFFEVSGPSRAMFDTLMTALIYDLKVEIIYYEKAGTKQIARITVKK